MTDKTEDIAVALFSELLIADQLARARIAKVLPRGMELSQFSVLNHLARLNEERSPAQLARAFHVTRGAMTNTLTKLEWAGHVHIRPDWDDARRKWVSLSPAGQAARDRAVIAIAPVFDDLVARLGAERLRGTLPLLRAIREGLDPGSTSP
jgi:DNA-binding MarR family transcriptional regulator